jgi:hypothetical protein
MYAKVVPHKHKVGAIVVAAALAAGIAVTLAGGATAANKHVTHHARTTAHLENNPNPGTRDVGFTG